MDNIEHKFTEWAKSSGWTCELAREKLEIPQEILARYKRLPQDFLDFISKFSNIINAGENMWLLTAKDYLVDDDDAYRWNEFELMSLDWMDDDKEGKAEITAFWDNFLPIFMSVAGDYHYYAINIKTGEIFEGWSPEFEEPQIAAPSFTEFIERVISREIELR